MTIKLLYENRIIIADKEFPGYSTINKFGDKQIRKFKILWDKGWGMELDWSSSTHSDNIFAMAAGVNFIEKPQACQVLVENKTIEGGTVYCYFGIFHKFQQKFPMPKYFSNPDQAIMAYCNAKFILSIIDVIKKSEQLEFDLVNLDIEEGPKHGDRWSELF